MVGKRFPALSGQRRLRFLRTGTTFLVVRDPIERLVSAFLVTHATWNSDELIVHC